MVNGMRQARLPGGEDSRLPRLPQIARAGDRRRSGLDRAQAECPNVETTTIPGEEVDLLDGGFVRRLQVEDVAGCEEVRNGHAFVELLDAVQRQTIHLHSEGSEEEAPPRWCVRGV